MKAIRQVVLGDAAADDDDDDDDDGGGGGGGGGGSTKVPCLESGRPAPLQCPYCEVGADAFEYTPPSAGAWLTRDFRWTDEMQASVHTAACDHSGQWLAARDCGRLSCT